MSDRCYDFLPKVRRRNRDRVYSCPHCGKLWVVRKSYMLSGSPIGWGWTQVHT